MLKQLVLFPNQDVLDLSSMRLEPVSRKFFISGRYIFLRNKEFALLEYFMSNVGTVLSRTQLLEAVWDRNIFCSTNTVDVHVSTLRTKMRKYSSHDLIRTVHCIGYIFEP
jgi:two-component system copper resistance phosphate regulon response regulator CusR